MSVTAPLGFRAAGVAAGLKTSGERDVAVVIQVDVGNAAERVEQRFGEGPMFGGRFARGR